MCAIVAAPSPISKEELVVLRQRLVSRKLLLTFSSSAFTIEHSNLVGRNQRFQKEGRNQRFQKEGPLATAIPAQAGIQKEISFRCKGSGPWPAPW